jgi:hypothetical protein
MGCICKLPHAAIWGNMGFEKCPSSMWPPVFVILVLWEYGCVGKAANIFLRLENQIGAWPKLRKNFIFYTGEKEWGLGWLNMSLT